MGCKSQKIVGRDVAIEFFIGCGTELPIESQWNRLGSMRTKEFNLEWETIDATADDSIGSLRENLASFQSLSISGDGAVKISGDGAAELIALSKHVAKPDATEGQPVAWVRITFPDITYTAFMIISNMSRSAPYDDLVTYSFEANSTASDFGLIVEDTPDANAPAATSLEAIPATLQIGMGSSFDAVAIINPPQADQGVRWTSSDAAVASVNALSGSITGVALGTATITATANSNNAITDTIAATVVSQASSISVSPLTVSVADGATSALTASVLPATAPQGLLYSTSDAAVATVNGSGVITGVNPGTATVTVRSSFAPGILKTVAVTVTA
jgi:predicted secreted protein